MPLHVDRDVSLAVAHEEVGLADPVSLVVDGQPAAGHRRRASGERTEGQPDPGLGVFGVDDDGALDAGEELLEYLVLVLEARRKKLLEKGRVRQRRTRAQDVELDALGAGLGEVGVPRRDLDAHRTVVSS